MLVDILLVVGNEGLGNGLANGVNLRGMATARHPNTDVDFGELVHANDEERLVDLETQAQLGQQRGSHAGKQTGEDSDVHFFSG